MALLAVVIGGVQLMSAKGTSLHKVLGYIWVSLMMYVPISSLCIFETRLWGAYSPINVLSVWTVLTLYPGVYFPCVGNIKAHQLNMQLLFGLALILTGLFTLLPNRLMGRIFFGA